jgi:hypothetical protein
MPAETLNGTSLHDEMAFSDCLLTKNILKDVWEWLSELSTMFNNCASLCSQTSGNTHPIGEALQGPQVV